MSDQDNEEVSTIQRPTTDDPEAWKTYWESKGWPWRTEPEISTERQKFLKERLSIIPNLKQGIYPLRGIKLNRADVEWLIDIHEAGQIEHKLTERARGLDFRGADLSHVDLHRLPLTQLQGGVLGDAWMSSTKEEREAAAIHLEGAKLAGTDLTWAKLRCGHLEGADLSVAHLEGTVLRHAYLNGAQFRLAYFSSSTRLDEILLGDKKGYASLMKMLHALAIERNSASVSFYAFKKSSANISFLYSLMQSLDTAIDQAAAFSGISQSSSGLHSPTLQLDTFHSFQMHSYLA